MVFFAGKSNPLYYQFEPLLSYPEIRHGIFTRNSGHSPHPFHSLNISFGLGDDPRNVLKNRQVVSDSMGGRNPIFLDQMHGTDVFVADGNDRLSGSLKPEVPKADAAITDVKGNMLVVQVADCQPIFLYDPARKVVAGVHSGWRGSINNIIEKTIRVMKTRFECDPKRLIACIGPSLGPCCAEFIHYRTEIPEKYWAYKDRSNRIDFWSISRDQLLDAGISASHIHVSGICTHCRTDLFFSYRSEKRTGRFASAIGLTNEQETEA